MDVDIGELLRPLCGVDAGQFEQRPDPLQVHREPRILATAGGGREHSAHQPVGAHFLRVVDADVEGKPAVRLAHHERAGVEIAVAEDAEVEDHARHGSSSVQFDARVHPRRRVGRLPGAG